MKKYFLEVTQIVEVEAEDDDGAYDAAMALPGVESVCGILRDEYVKRHNLEVT